MEGGCGCGAVRYSVTGPPKWASHCHCRDCRRTAGAAYVTYIGLDTAQVTLARRHAGALSLVAGRHPELLRQMRHVARL